MKFHQHDEHLGRLFHLANAGEKTKDAKTQGNVNSADWGSSFANRGEYVMWGFSARREKFALTLGHETLRPEDLKTAALALMKDWDSALRQVVRQTSDLGVFPVKTSVPVPPWETRNVTLLGDALHNMTPYRGMGANMASRDAAALRRALVNVARGETLLLEALAGYEQEMIEHGFSAVRWRITPPKTQRSIYC